MALWPRNAANPELYTTTTKSRVERSGTQQCTSGGKHQSSRRGSQPRMRSLPECQSGLQSRGFGQTALTRYRKISRRRISISRYRTQRVTIDAMWIITEQLSLEYQSGQLLVLGRPPKQRPRLLLVLPRLLTRVAALPPQLDHPRKQPYQIRPLMGSGYFSSAGQQ